MKRKVFNVLIDGKIVATKYAYNTARREIAAQVKAQAKVGHIWEMQNPELRKVGEWCKQRWTLTCVLFHDGHERGEFLIAEVRQQKD